MSTASLFTPLLRTHGEEILDREGLSGRGRAILEDLDRWNERSGWYRFHLARIREWWIALGRPRPFRILDVGTGPGGLLEAIARGAAQDGIEVELTGIDLQDDYVDIARKRLGSRAQVMRGDATRLDVPDHAWDLATSTLMMHHLPMPVRAAMVQEIGRVARGAYLFDLEITLYGAAGWLLMGRLAGMGADARHDGLLSIRRGCTLGELTALCEPLPVRVRRVFPSALCTVPRSPAG